MSAINGVYNHKSFTDVENKVKLMNSLNRHRGPDFSNTYLDTTICLGHNGLSIINIDSKPNQPFISLDKNIVLSYDGVIYNLLELKKELSKSYKFKTETESELIACLNNSALIIVPVLISILSKSSQLVIFFVNYFCL